MVKKEHVLHTAGNPLSADPKDHTIARKFWSSDIDGDGKCDMCDCK